MQYLLCYLAQGQEQEKDVLDVMANFFAKYGEKFEGLPHIFYFDVVLIFTIRRMNFLEMKGLGVSKVFSKSQVSRSARHRKKHGMESSQAPSIIAREKFQTKASTREGTGLDMACFNIQALSKWFGT